MPAKARPRACHELVCIHTRHELKCTLAAKARPRTCIAYIEFVMRMDEFVTGMNEFVTRMN